MKKLVICIIIVAVVVLGFFAFNKKSDEKLDNENIVNNEAVVENDETVNTEDVKGPEKVDWGEELTNLVDTLYAGNENLYPSLMSQLIDVTDAESVNYMTGLENGDDLEALIVSEPMMSSQAYSLVIAKVKAGSNPDEVAKKMSENINMRKWICVSADVLYATSTEEYAFLVMSSEEMAKPVYEAFKTELEIYGEEYTRKEVVEELPEDMY